MTHEIALAGLITPKSHFLNGTTLNLENDLPCKRGVKVRDQFTRICWKNKRYGLVPFYFVLDNQK